ncbi:MAG: outer membrane protein assembly factor BamA [Treponema sp.]|nr:outer membrane protein assembly factor BamA [Treponema sp.]
MRFKVFVLLLLFFVSIFGFSQNSSDLDEYWFYGKPIREILFSGNRSVSTSELDALTSSFRGRIFDDNVFWEVQGRLYALEYFDRIEPSVVPVYTPDLEVSLRFNVIERPVIDRIIFSGNSGVTRRELNDVILSRVNDIYNQSKVRLDIEAIINKYIEKGYPNITVTTAETQPSGSDTGITLVFNITEHERISISRIEFQGNTKFTGNALRNQISLRQRSIINDGAFQEAKLLADREAVAKYYHDRGFIDAYVRDVTRSYEDDSRGTNLILTFLIEEGTEFRFAGITFEGNFIFSDEQLDKLISSRVGDIINMTRLEMDLQRVADLYFENGYIYNSIIRTPNKDNQTNTLSYTVSIIERSRAYIENITIIGNERTRNNVIMREIPLEPGDIFSRTKILEAMRNLYNLQYFSMIIPDTLQGSSENLMDLVFTLEEQPTTDIQFGITFSGSADPDSFPISGIIQWNDRNLAGTGNQLGIELNSSVVDSHSASINYTHRYIFGIPLSVGFDASYTFSKRWAQMDNQPPFFIGNEPGAFPDGFGSYDEYVKRDRTPSNEFLMSYVQHNLSLGISTGYRWSTFLGIFGISGGYRIGGVINSYDSEIFRPFDPTLRKDNNKIVLRNSLWFALSLDQRDIFYDPSRGYYLYQRLGVNGFFDVENERYLRSDSRFQLFFTLWDVNVTENWSFKGVLAFNSAVSVLFRQPGGDKNFPILNSNKLAIDGMFNARGWNTEYSNKGLIMLDSWAELRVPLVHGILAWDFFFDMAAVDNDKGNYTITGNDLRFSFGGGLRFTIPQFPIRLSIAKRFKLTDGNVEWQTGIIGGNSVTNNRKGMDFVMSFAISY